MSDPIYDDSLSGVRVSNPETGASIGRVEQVGSSKVWRIGRWWWYCTVEACAAASRLTYSTAAEARRAGQRHASRFGHDVAVSCIGGAADAGDRWVPAPTPGRP